MHPEDKSFLDEINSSQRRFCFIWSKSGFCNWGSLWMIHLCPWIRQKTEWLVSQPGFEFWFHLMNLLFDHKNVLVHQVIHRHGRSRSDQAPHHCFYNFFINVLTNLLDLEISFFMSVIKNPSNPSSSSPLWAKPEAKS